ncbi:cytosolic carboxypeptidase Nna1-like isoform X2 [Malaya genurostris]|uniref:cytosolic carboxypeptidase Nna1-like isoform X2 n=1 Tax=Malaya genurostris TaxID=325434 RepID=UPI0026F3CD0D|nr:cytosolic carboxypeptidase Nna1-like isoform X2 [Malaya genurostris]
MMDAPVNFNEAGYLGSFLSNSLKTNQLEVNTDSKTLRPIARLKEPRELFALPKERDYDCPQQAPRWPLECQVLDERVYHINYAPESPEPYYQPTGKELQPRPVGEENGVIVFNYNPTSAVHYDQYRYSPVLDLDDDSQWRYYGYENDTDEDSSSGAEYDDSCLRYEPSEYDDGMTREEINDESEIFTRKQLEQLALNQIQSELPVKPEDLTGCSSSSASPAQDKKSSVVPQHLATSRSDQSFYASEPESDNDSEGEQSKHDGIDEPPPLLLTSTITNHTQDADDNPNPNNKHTLPSTDSSPSPTVPPVPQFTRSTVGGSKAQPTAHPNAFDPDDLIFESRFESGNLGRAIKITPTYYELYLRPDMYTNRHTQWFYFRVKNTKAKVVYRFSIINLTKPDSLYKEGMRPLLYSTLDAEYNHVGWQRCGENIAYFRNDSDNGYGHSGYHHRMMDDDDDDYMGNSSFTLSFNIEFKYDDDTVYFAHSYPYTYSDLQDYLMSIQRNPVKSKFCKLRLLCRSLAGNNVYYLTVTAPTTHEDDNQKKKKAVIITARVHPGESPASWMMKGLMDFITGDSYVAKKLRHKFIFKLVPMLNPDGVIVGNTRSSLTGRDLNRQYRTVIRETYPSIWNTKAMIRRLMEDCGVAMYCDMHAHSRKHNVFIYGCENLKRHPDRRLLEQVFPLMLHKNVADKFSFENCKFKVQKNKEGTGRIVVWVLGVTNSYTLEASFGGSTMGGRSGTHFSTADYEHIGRAYCETLMDYYDDNPIKEKLRMKILTRLSKEGSSADEPLNIPLSDYSSDEGDTSTSSSEDEAGKDSMAELEGPCCSSLKVPPSSPVLPQKLKGNKKGKKRNPPKLCRRRTNNSQRVVLDIPTAEPASDFFDFTSDEENNPSGNHPIAVSDTENTVNRNLRRKHKLRQSNRIKKLTALGCETQYLMPPELIVRSAASRYQSEDEDDKNKLVMSIIKEFPPVIGKDQSWRGYKRERNRIQIKAMSPDQFFPQLSYRRSIWTGTHSDGYVNEISTISPRPLSWGVPPALIKSTQFDCEAVLTACSQKLTAWKNEKRHQKERHQKSISRLAAVAATSVNSRGDKENRSAASRFKLSNPNEQLGSKQKLMADKKSGESFDSSSITKTRRKTRNTLNKIAEKAEIPKHFPRSARSSQSRRLSNVTTFLSNSSPRKSTSTNNLLDASTVTTPPIPTGTSLLVASQSLRTPTHQDGAGRSRFKTGGIVVTAAQPLPRQRKSHQLRAIRNSILPAQAGNSGSSPTKLPTATAHTIDLQLTTLCSETESEKNLRIQVNSKKHRKKRTVGNHHRKPARLVVLN